MKFTGVFWKTFSAFTSGKRFVINKGGSRSGKTYSALQLLHLTIKSDPKPTVNSVVAMTIPHLKKGAIRDFMKILRECKEHNIGQWNASDYTYTYPNGAILEFFSADSDKVHGAQRDRLFVNECQFIPYETIRQLLVRTSGQVMFDYNPIKRFWIDEKLMENPENDGKWVLIQSTYKDNSFLSQAQIDEIESNRYDANWWQVYGEGITGSVRSGFEFYSTFKRQPVKTVIEQDKALHISFDFNVVPYISATVGQLSQDGATWTATIIKEFALKNPYNHSETLAQFIAKWINETFTTKPTLFIYGDATGSKNSTVSFKNDYDQINSVLSSQFKINWRVPKSNPRLKARRDFMNKILADQWVIKCRFDESCKMTMDDFENVLEDPEGGKMKQTVRDEETRTSYQPYGHLSDCIDYFFCEAFRDWFGK